MAQRLCASIVQPCILCEGPQEVWDVWIDEEYDVETIIRRELGHRCLAMTALNRERSMGRRNGDKRP
jgi:hypothetical protein